MALYVGISGGGQGQSNLVFKDQKPLLLEKSLALADHSPTGFSWGYYGSGPAQLALAMLREETTEAEALEAYGMFAEEVIAKLPTTLNFVLLSKKIQCWLQRWRKKPGQPVFNSHNLPRPMTTRQATFGRVITEARKKLELSQKDLAAQVKKEDGKTISAQYLNDIEHDRRNPPSEYILEQLALILKINKDYLYYLAGQLPSDLRSDPSEQKKVEAAFKAFRRTLKDYSECDGSVFKFTLSQEGDRR